MAVEAPEFDTSRMGYNIDALGANPYPGRGIVLGRSEDNELVQAYWVMGRGTNSRNRVLVEEGTTVKTEAFDPSKVDNPSLIIYNAMRVHETRQSVHIVSNGNHTDTLYDALTQNLGYFELSFRDALLMREFEPDSPIFTPRIMGAISVGKFINEYRYGIIRRNPTTGMSEHAFGNGELSDIPAGAGLCFHTYAGDGDPVPAFEGSPYAIPLDENADEISHRLWGALNFDNKVGIAVRTIDPKSGDITDTKIINKLGEE